MGAGGGVELFFGCLFFIEGEDISRVFRWFFRRDFFYLFFVDDE